MATFHFDLVSPERLLFSGEVEQVDVPGSEGEFGVLADHAPLVAMLKPGILVVHGGTGGPQRIAVDGGFAEVSAAGLTVLADMAVPVEQFDHARLAQAIKEAEEDLTDAAEDRVRDKVTHRLAQLRALQEALGQGSSAGH
jgi:F-type H+-transporting ATPase subunit epsilon